MIKTYLAILIIAAATATVTVLASMLATFTGDEGALLKLRDLRTPWLTDTATVVSTLGMGGIGWGLAVPWVPVVAVAAVLALRRWADAVFMALATLAPVVNLGLKELVSRPRPDPELWLVAETGYAFPSGHAVFAASFLGALIWLAGREAVLDGHPLARRTVQAALVLLILAIGLSRVNLGVHWPSDVIGGFLFGVLYLSLLTSIRLRAEVRRAGDGGLRKESLE